MSLLHVERYDSKTNARIAGATLAVCKALEMYAGEVGQAGYARMAVAARAATTELVGLILALPGVKLVAYPDEKEEAK